MTVTGHEDEFRRLFEREAGTRLATLAERAMELETGSEDPELVTEMFRAAHTIKGGAAVVGFDDVSAVVHQLEQLLEELRSGERRADGGLVDGVLAAVDAVRAMVACAMADTDASAPADAALAAIAAARGEEPPATAPAIEDAGEAEPAQPAEAPPHTSLEAEVPSPHPALEPEPARQRVLPTPRGPIPALAPAAPPRPGGDAIAVPVARLDELVRLVGESAAALLRIGRLLSDRLGDDPAVVDEYRELARLLHEVQERTMRARMVSVGTVAGPLRRTVRDIARASGKQVRWELDGEDTELDRHVLEQLREPLVALVRNAADHGIEPPDERAAHGKPEEAVVRVEAGQVGADVVIAVSDDGRGIDVERVSASAGRRLSEAGALGAIFEPGLTTAERVSGVSGRGVGLDAVRSAVEELRGRVEVRSRSGAGTEFRIRVPMTLAVVRCLLVRAGEAQYALPMHSTTTALPAPPGAVVSTEGRQVIVVDGEAIGFADLSAVLGTPARAARGRRSAVLLVTTTGRHAFGVDELMGQRDVVVKDLGRFVPRLPLVAGASVEPDGSIMLVLDADGLVATARAAPPQAPERAPGAPQLPATRARLLVVDDALTIRELQRSILERAGYEVGTAADGAAALRALEQRPADLVLTDVEMPGMDGFALAEAIRRAPQLSSIPVIVLSSCDDDADRARGLEAGADAYLVKKEFDAATLLDVIRRLLGEDP